MLVEKTKNTGLEATDNNLVAFSQILRLQLNSAVIVQPHDFSVGELLFIKHCKTALNVLHLLWNLALRYILIRPVSAGQDFCCELCVINNVRAIVSLFEC